MNIRKAIKIILRFIIWPISILILLMGVLFSFIHLKSSILLTAAGLIVFPPFWKLIGKKLSFKFPGWVKVVLFVVLSIAWLETLPPSTKMADVKITNDKPSPTPTTQVQQLIQEPEKNEASNDDKTTREAGFDQKGYENTAKAYCNERKADARLYPILELEEGADGKAELKPVTSKQGKSLTQEDCMSVMVALAFTNKLEKAQDIAEGKYWVGMDFFEIGYSLGTPDDRTTKTERGWLGTKETEVLTYYGNGGYRLYLHLENKILTKWTEDY